MTNQQHPITPPPDLVEQWHSNSPLDRGLTLATQAAQWGADQELEACCKVIRNSATNFSAAALLEAQRGSDNLRAARRPKTPSLKEQALYELDELFTAIKQLGVFNPPKSIRQALEQLND